MISNAVSNTAMSISSSYKDIDEDVDNISFFIEYYHALYQEWTTCELK